MDYSSPEWADWDEDCHGPMDSEENKRLYPRGFKWTCCGTEGGDIYRDVNGENRDGCEQDAHIARSVDVSKKRRMYT